MLLNQRLIGCPAIAIGKYLIGINFAMPKLVARKLDIVVEWSECSVASAR
ncbi:MAG: hypothetical protein WCE30_13090 [Mycobacterium sp.]